MCSANQPSTLFTSPVLQRVSSTVRLSLPVLLRVLLVSALALSLCSSYCVVHSAGSGPYDPNTPSSLLYNVTECNATLDDIARSFPALTAHTFSRVEVNAYQSVAALCPSTCLIASSITPLPAVYGSYPYHGRSSACLAAIHVGIIDGSVGGGFFINRFYRHDWSNSSTQTIFPYHSANGTYSNGVSSRKVDSSWYSVPSNASEYSYVVRARGETIVQRRQAPYAARSNHLYLLEQYRGQDSRLSGYTVHVIAGGYNGTHYLNDVWCGVQLLDNRYSDIEWYRTDDAPFTPRSDVTASRQLLDPILIAGGQTEHRCGLYELGVCSDEVWRLQVNVTLAEHGTVLPVVGWSERPVTHLPHSPAPCQFGAVVASPVNTEAARLSYTSYTVFSGQLSYNDSTCSSPPTTVNTAWTVSISTATGEAMDGWRLINSPLPPQRITSPVDCAGTYCAIGGGLRHVALRAASPVSATLTASELEDGMFVIEFDGPSLNMSGAQKVSLSFPVAHSPFPSIPQVVGYRMSQLIGGRYSQESLRQWRNTPPVLDSLVRNNRAELAINRTILISQPSSPPWTDNTTFALYEAELNDPDGWYVNGAPYTQFFQNGFYYSSTTYSTIHYQPTALASHPNESTWFMPTAASSRNTSRPLFNFPLARHSHASTQLVILKHIMPVIWWQPFELTPPIAGQPIGIAFISGGRTGDVYHSDILQSHPPRCLPPIDPSFLPVLGPMRVVASESDRINTGGGGTLRFWLNSYTNWPYSDEKIGVRCQHNYHFEPPLLDIDDKLLCMANGMWMSYETLTIRRCVRDVLQCSFPLTDLGAFDCEPTPPTISEVSASYTYNGELKLVRADDSLTLIDLPLLGGVSLSIYGDVFVEPVRVSVAGSVANIYCINPVLRATGYSPLGTMVYNISGPNGAAEPVEARYGPLIVCTLESALSPGLLMRVQVSSGLLQEPAEVSADSSAAYATLSTMAPRLTRVGSRQCEQSHSFPLSLTNCVINQTLTVEVCASLESVGESNFRDDGPLSLIGASPTSATLLSCSAFQMPPGGALQRCGQCSAYPRIGFATLFLRQPSTLQYSESAATLLYQQCSAGTREVSVGAGMSNPTDLCERCPAGSSTEGNSGAAQCTLCSPGRYSNTIGSPSCSSCPVGTEAPYTNSTLCTVCSPNSYANATAQQRCQVCSLNTYIVLARAEEVGRKGECRECPAMSSCYDDGNITAAAATYLIIDQSTGTLQSIPCSSSACVSGDVCLRSGFQHSQSIPSAPQLVQSSKLSVVNCCGVGRWPAYVSNSGVYEGVDELTVTHGHNPLCGACLPGHSAVNGRCIECSETAVSYVILLVLLSLLLVWLVHRVPHDWSGSASVLIVSNFVQLSTTILSSESMPQVLSLVNVNLLGDHTSGRGQVISDQWTAASHDDTLYAGVCVVPLTDADRIVVGMVSPLIALALLGCVAVLQLAMQRCVSSVDSPVRRRRAAAVYRFLCVPSQPRVKLSVMSASDRHVSLLSADIADAAATSTASTTVATSDRTIDVFSVHTMLACYQRSVVRLCLLSYTGLAVLCCSFFQWQSVGEFGFRLRAFSTLRPDSPSYQHLLPLMVVLTALVVAGMPLITLSYLYIEHRRGEVANVKAKQLSVSGSSVNLSAQQDAVSVLSVRQSLTLQLIAMFRPRYWWMLVLVLLRRLVVIVLLTLVGSSQVWSWLAIVHVCFLTLHTQTMPYERVRDNTLEMLTLLSLSLQCVMLTLYPPPYMSEQLLATLVTLVVTPLLPLVLTTVLRVWKQLRRCSHRTNSSETDCMEAEVSFS